jgi:hypothetical protein
LKGRFGLAYLLLSLGDKPVITNHLADNLLCVALGLSRNRVTRASGSQLLH